MYPLGAGCRLHFFLNWIYNKMRISWLNYLISWHCSMIHSVYVMCNIVLEKCALPCNHYIPYPSFAHFFFPHCEPGIQWTWVDKWDATTLAVPSLIFCSSLLHLSANKTFKILILNMVIIHSFGETGTSASWQQRFSFLL